MGFFDFMRKKQTDNKFNQSFYWGGNGYTNNDDTNANKYIEEGYNINGDVFSIVNQISNKLISIPYSVKKIESKQAKTKHNKLLKAVNYNPSVSQKVRLNALELKSYVEGEMNLPFETPNPTQNWDEFFKLSEDFLNLTGNIYWYKLMPEEGADAGSPIQVYCLPSHLIEIVLRNDANMLSVDSPIDYYIMEDRNTFIKFKKDEVVHISINNPNYGTNGEHLYGQSPLRAVWRNIEASNKGLDLNLNTLKNGGVFGFIHSKGTALTGDQAQELKERLKEMNKSPEDLSRIAGISAEIGFTRLSLSADELKPFEYLKYNQKQICNALGWSDTLLNNDDGGKYDKQVTELKRVLINTVLPHVKMIENAFNQNILQTIKGYEDSCLYFNYKELPEMQIDIETMSKWIVSLKDVGMLTGNEGRNFIGLEPSEDPNMDMFTVKDDIMSLEDALLPKDELTL